MHTRPLASRRGSRLFALILLAVFLAILGTAGYTYVAYRQAAADLVMERDRQLAFLSAARLQAELSKFSQTLASVTRTEGILGGTPSAQQAALEREAFRLADFDGGVVLLDHFGRVAAALPAQPTVTGQDWSRRDLFRQVLLTRGPVFDNSLPSATATDRVISLGVPVLGEGGQFAGALVGMFRLGEPTVSSFYASIVMLRLGQSGNLYIVDGAGIVLYDSHSTATGHGFYGSVVPTTDLPGEAGSVRLKSTEGKDELISYATIPGTPWMLVTEVDWRTLTASTRPYANLLLGALVIGMVIPAMAVGVLVRQRNKENLAQAQDQELTQIAHKMHRTLVPREIPILAGWDAIVHRPSAHPAGQLIDDHLLLPDGRLMISLLQVTEGGVGGAVSMVSARAALRGAAQCGLSPSEALHRANDLLCLDNGSGRPIYALFGILDPGRGEFSFAHVGLVPPVHLPALEAASAQPVAGSLGVQAGQVCTAGSMIVGRGAMLLLSVGLIGARNAAGEAFGADRASACFAKGALDCADGLQDLLAEARQFGLSPDEGILIVLLKRDASPEAGMSRNTR